jgi:cell division septal protein FtsQ
MMGPGLVERTLYRVISALQFALLACLLVCAGHQSYYIFFKAKYFRIQEIEVQGNRDLTRHEVVRLSGVERYDLFFRYNYDQVRRNLLASPRIEEARIVIRSPDTVQIQVRERTPHFRTQGGARAATGATPYEVDRDGTVLGPARTASAALPVLEGATLVRAPDGSVLLAPGQAQVVRQWARLLDRSVLRSYTALDVGSAHRVAIRWKDQVVLAADPVNFEKHVGLVERVLGEAADRGKTVSAVDMRFGNVVLKLASAR